MAETMRTVFDIMEPDGGTIITAESIAALRTLFGDRLISEFTGKEPRDVAPEIVASRERIQLPESIPAAKLAVAMLNFMREMGFTAAAKPQEQVVRVVQDKHPRDMNLRELLEELDKNPSRYTELVQYINAQLEVQTAIRKSPNWAVTVAGSKDRLDVDVTMTRVDSLNKHTIVQNKMADGRYPTSLARVFGQEERYMLNPFASSLDEAAVRGPIWRDYDLGNLSEEVHLAYIWARFIVGHKVWPPQIDNYDHLSQAFAPVLSERWLEIVEDYRSAKQNGDPSVEGLSRYLSPQDLRSRRPFVGNAPQRDETWYKRQLEQRAGRAIEQINSSIRLERRIIRSARTTNSNITLTDVIALGSIVTSNSNIRGRFYVPQGTHISTSHGSITPDIFELDYEGLYNKAIELGIISE